jgi:hypothetical protein
LWDNNVVNYKSERNLNTTYRCYFSGAKSHIFYIFTNKELDYMTIGGDGDKYKYGYVPYGTDYEQKLTDLLVHDGSKKLFEKLEEVYKELFITD